MKRIVGLVVLGVVVLIGCVAKYQPIGSAGGGYSDARIDANTFIVEFHRSGVTPWTVVEKYMLYRCAEVTVASGFDYFVVVEGSLSPEEETHTKTTPGKYESQTTGSATASGNMASGSAQTTGKYIPPKTETYTVKKTDTKVRIKGFNGVKPPDNPNAYDAHEVIKYLGPSIQK